MKILLFIVIPILLTLSGCATIQVQRAKAQMQSTFDSLMGCSEEEVISIAGAPQNIQHIEGVKVYQYYQSYGVRTNAFANTLGYGAYSIGNAYEAYDNVDIIFKNGRAISWKGYVQR